MSIICPDYGLLFTHVPKTGGIFVEKTLMDLLGGTKVGPRHATVRILRLDDVPPVRAFVAREPLSWYRSVWAYSRSIARHRAAWPVWDTGTYHPTRPLDETCGSASFEGFIRNVLREFPHGFVRSMYCNFLNGTTHVLRTDRLNDDVEHLLKLVGYPDPTAVATRPRENESPSKWKDQTTLPADLEAEIRAVDNLDGLLLPYVTHREVESAADNA